MSNDLQELWRTHFCLYFFTKTLPTTRGGGGAVWLPLTTRWKLIYLVPETVVSLFLEVLSEPSGPSLLHITRHNRIFFLINGKEILCFCYNGHSFFNLTFYFLLVTLLKTLVFCNANFGCAVWTLFTWGLKEIMLCWFNTEDTQESIYLLNLCLVKPAIYVCSLRLTLTVGVCMSGCPLPDPAGWAD